MMRKLSLLALISLTAGCTAEPGASMQLVHVMAPDQQCEYKEEGKGIILAGFFDPTAANQMATPVRLHNSMNSRDTDPRRNDNNANIKSSANDVVISGFNVCYKQESALGEFGLGDSGHAFECDSVINATAGEYKEFINSGGVVPADPQNQSVGQIVYLELFSRSALQGIFGEALLPERVVLPASLSTDCLSEGVGADGRASSVCTSGVTAASATLDTTSHAALLGVSEVDDWPWGEWAEADRPSQNILVLMQAVGITQAGYAIKSNWLSHPVKLCVGCTKVTQTCPYDLKRVLCNPGNCTRTDPGGGPDVVEACTNPAGLPDGTSGCPDNGVTACNGMVSETIESQTFRDGYCDESQLIGTTTINLCIPGECSGD